MLKFNDGIEINTQGPLRKMRLYDGWYVVGDGMLLPAEDEAEADVLIDIDARKV